MANILTLRLDGFSQHYFERLRQMYFPVARNLVPAHVTLFHRLPDLPEVQAELETLARVQESFSVKVTGIRSLGAGVAFTLSSPALQQLHAGLAKVFRNWLTAQDRQKFMPHVVVQNKETAEAARALLRMLEQEFHAMQAEACGIDLWEYLGGPWRLIHTYRFLNSGE